MSTTRATRSSRRRREEPPESIPPSITQPHYATPPSAAPTLQNTSPPPPPLPSEKEEEVVPEPIHRLRNSRTIAARKTKLKNKTRAKQLSLPELQLSEPQVSVPQVEAEPESLKKQSAIPITSLLTSEELDAMPSLLPRSASSSSSSPEREHQAQRERANHHKTLLQLEQEKSLERNIDKVIFGDIVFKSWYPSWYPKEVLGEKALSGEGKGIVVDKLWVCERCFGYAKDVAEGYRHRAVCERGVPGKKVYSHGEEGVWGVWEVDGAVDTTFCQSLSLFAKLFLDNKSVFFDVSSFNYFLLVHTHPTTGAQQIVGFFSKEKMSWDSNNLACILIFPPWQRKGLGSILMGVSYEISRREEIMGGPEKPISDLGKKGYKRYWGVEIARWLLGVKETDKKKGRGMVDVEMISRETWIQVEDCLGVLKDMGVLEKAGKGKGTVERVRVDKKSVREWVAQEGVCLDRVVDGRGFVEGYALKGVAEKENGDVEMGE